MASHSKTNQSGFTLVELAIALMIIGLLIGGVLKGIELVENARVTQVMRNVKAYETAMTSFQSIYSALPGDINRPGDRIPNCTADPCQVSGNGNGIINDAAITAAPAGINTTMAVPAVPSKPSGTTAGETYNFWLHLAATNLVSGVDPTGSEATAMITDPVQWGKSFPASPVIGAGFLVQNVRGAGSGAGGTLSAPYNTNARFQGHYAILRGANVGDGVLTGNQALQIDTKFDDGLPGSGDIIVAAGTGGATNADCVTGSIYQVNSDVKACVLFLRLSK